MPRPRLSHAAYLGLAFICSTAAAEASSFLAVAPPKPGSTSSFVVLGTPARPIAAAEADASDILAGLPMPVYPATGPQIVQISPSIVAMGEPAPAVTYEQVAAVPERAGRHEIAMPLVIRGGIIGDGSTTAIRPAADPRSRTAASSSPRAPRTADAKPKAATPASSAQRRPDPPPPPSPSIAPPPPPPSMRVLGEQN